MSYVYVFVFGLQRKRSQTNMLTSCTKLVATTPLSVYIFINGALPVHTLLLNGIADLRPKGRGRPQRILLGVWPDEHIRGVIRAVVFRDSHAPHAAHHIKEEVLPGYPAITVSIALPQQHTPNKSNLMSIIFVLLAPRHREQNGPYNICRCEYAIAKLWRWSICLGHLYMRC